MKSFSLLSVALGLASTTLFGLTTALPPASAPPTVARAVAANGIKTYNFEITWAESSPNGESRQMLLVNGQSPGPVIKADQDNTIVVNVRNNSPFNTTLHFHGIEMRGTPWSDGVPGVTQRPILPGRTFTYTFLATQHGAYWYHAHFRGQIEDGLYGAMQIQPRDRDPKPFERISRDKRSIDAMKKAEKNAKPLVISDLTHLTSDEKWEITMAAGTEISCYDAILFNGKGSNQCIPEAEIAAAVNPTQQLFLGMVGMTMTDKACLPAEAIIAATGGFGDPTAIPDGIFSGCNPTQGEVEKICANRSPSCSGPADEWIALDIIGAINFHTGVVSIDEHDMWVYAMDGSYIEPQKVQALGITNGDRYSVLVKIQRAGEFKIRVASNTAAQMLIGHAVLSVPTVAGRYETPVTNSQPWIDIVGLPLSENVVFFVQNTAAPFPPDKPAQKADALHVLTMRVNGASYLWALNSTGLMPEVLDHETPVLFAPDVNAQDNVTITTKHNQWIDLVFLASAAPMPPHPIHKHGNKMYQIGAGEGPFTWSSVEEAMRDIPQNFNLDNPPRRDAFATSFAVTGPTWIVVRYKADNPGAWLLHCHVNNHMLGGMMMVIQDAVDQWPYVPPFYKNY